MKQNVTSKEIIIIIGKNKEMRQVHKTLLDLIVKYINDYDKNVDMGLAKIDSADYENKSEVYISFDKKQDLGLLLSSLQFDFELNKVAFELNNEYQGSFVVWEFYIASDTCLGTMNIDGQEECVYNVETRVMLIDRHKKSIYHQYLNSKEWNTIRNKMLKFSDYKCSRCFETENLQVHHLNYNSLGNESLGDLEVLCSKCHQGVHKINA